MIGDFTPGKTIPCRFNTHKADGTPITLAGTPAISVYKGSTTESTTGVTLTVDYDSRTGFHYVTVDTSSDGTFYAAGNDFDIVITTGTVDSISVVGTRVGTFSLSNRSALRPATADRTLVVDASGLADANMVKVGPTGAGINQSGVDLGAAVRNIAVTGAALNTTATSRTITTGTGTGGVSNTTGADGSYDNVADATGSIDFYYEFGLSAIVGGVGVGIQWTGYLAGVANTLLVYAYNWGTTAWDQVGTVVGIAGTANGVEEWELTSAHTGTGGSAGLVRLRFANTGLTSATLKTDRLLLGYAVVMSSVIFDAIADAILKRDWTSVSGEADRSALNALRFIRNKFSLLANPGNVRVYKEDDTTTAYEKPVTTQANADGITSG